MNRLATLLMDIRAYIAALLRHWVGLMGWRHSKRESARPVSMSTLPPMQSAFTSYEMRLAGVADYSAAVMPYILKRQAALPVFIEGSIVLSVAYLEDFLRSLVGIAAHRREAALRKYLSEHGNDADKAQAKTCDLIALVRMAKNRLSFKKGGASISRIFEVMFRCSPWPSDDERDVIHDLVLVRQMIVHAGSAEVGFGGVGQYAKQLRRADVLSVRSYGEWTTDRIDPVKLLRFYHEALIALQSQVNHLRDHIVKSDRWQQLP